MNRIIVIAGIILIGLMGLNSCGKKAPNFNADSSLNDTLTVLRNLDLLIEEDPNNAENYFARAQYHFQTESPASAVVDAQKAISLDSSKAEYYILLGDLNLILNKPLETRQCFLKALEVEPNNMEALMKFGEFNLYLQNYDSMFIYVNKALRIDKYNSKGYFLKGMAYSEMGDTAAAISSLQTCVEVDPDYFNAYMQLGTIFSDKRHPLAATYFKNAIDANPSKGEAYYGLAYFYQETGQPDEAINFYRAMLKLSPENPAALHNIGYIFLFDYNVKDSAIYYFDRAIRKDVRYANAIYHRGYAYELKGNKQAAKTDYEATLRVDSEHKLAELGLKRVSK